jgi:hypothetical protein
MVSRADGAVKLARHHEGEPTDPDQRAARGLRRTKSRRDALSSSRFCQMPTGRCA